MMTNAFYRVRPIAQALFEALFIVFIVFAGLVDASATGHKRDDGLHAKTSVNQQIGGGVLQSRGTSATASIVKFLTFSRDTITLNSHLTLIAEQKNLFIGAFERSIACAFSSASAP
jgi:hypothetical protein